MSIAQALLPELEFEANATRRVIQRVPADKWGWKAHEKSCTMGWNATHLAELLGWLWGTLAADEWDIEPPGGEPYRTPELSGPAECLDLFDSNLNKSRAALAKATDEEMLATWRLLKGGEVIMEMPRAAALRTWVMSHTVHHRAILTVYLRLNDIPVPAIYGPSGDELPDI